MRPARGAWPRARWLAVAAVALAAPISCADDGSSAVDAPAASRRIVEELDLPASLAPCLEAEFDARPAARRALDPQDAPSEDELDTLSDVVATCVPADTFALHVSAQMANGYRTVADIPPDEEHCLRDQIASLPDDERGLFVTGPVSRLRTPESERSLAVSELLSRLLAACDIVIDTGRSTPPTAAATPP